MNSKQYLQFIREIGCIVTGKPAEPHHPRFAGFMGKKSPDWLAIPLSAELHRMRHEFPAEFESLYGKEVDLLADTIRIVVQVLEKERCPF